MNENEIMEGLRRRDEAALCAAIDAYGNYVSAIICNLTRGMLGTEDAEETAADVFAGLWRSARNLREGAPLRPYLAQAARNAARSRLRGNRGVLLPLDEGTAAGASGPEEAAILREQTEIVNQAVSHMGEPDQEIFLRFYFFGERLAGIAARLGLGLPTVKTKLRRAREKLRAKLEERGYGREKAEKHL